MATRESVALPADDSIMSRRSIWSFRYLEHQNPSIISYIARSLVPIVATKEAVVLLANYPIMLAR